MTAAGWGESTPAGRWRVRWEIDLDAPSARAAALLAREIQLDPGSLATTFTVSLAVPTSVHLIDTADPPPPPPPRDLSRGLLQLGPEWVPPPRPPA